MTRGTLFHGVLLGAALCGAYLTWTRDKSEKAKTGDIVLWKASPQEIQEVAFHDDGFQDKDVVVERRDKYLWAKVTTVTKPPPKIPKPDAGADSVDPAEAVEDPLAQPDEPEPQPTTNTQEFVVGDEGTKLIEKVAPLRALRSLGPLDDGHKGEYGLSDPKDKLTVKVGGQSRELTVGGSVYGSEDRYVLDPGTKQVYVVSAEVWRPLTSHTLLKDGRLHAFPADDVSAVTLSWADKNRSILRKKAQPPGHMKPTWSDVAKPNEADQTLANFMDRVDQLNASEYLPAMTDEGLTKVVTLEYKDAKGAVIGKTELFKKPAAQPAGLTPPPGSPEQPQLDWFVRTERAPVFAKVFASMAQRVEQDLAAL